MCAKVRCFWEMCKKKCRKMRVTYKIRCLIGANRVEYIAGCLFNLTCGVVRRCLFVSSQPAPPIGEFMEGTQLVAFVIIPCASGGSCGVINMVEEAEAHAETRQGRQFIRIDGFHHH